MPASPITTQLAWIVSRRGRLPSAMDRARRQADDEAGAQPGRLPVLVRRPGPVLGPDGAAMGLDDLARDRQAEARILAEALVRPVGVEALEHPVEGMGLDARPVILDDRLHLQPAPAQDHPHG